MHGERVAGEQHVDVATTDQLVEVGAAAGVHDHRPGDEGDLAARPAGCAASSRQSGRRWLSTRRSDEISLVMKPKSARVRSRNSGVTRMPSRPQTTRSPALTSRSLRHMAPPSINGDHRVHPLARDFDPGAAEPDVRALVGGRVEIVRHAAVLVGDPDGGVLHLDRVAAERQQFLERSSRAGRCRRLDLQRQPGEFVVGAAERELAAPRTLRRARSPCRRSP